MEGSAGRARDGDGTRRAGDSGVSMPAARLPAPSGRTHQPGAARCPRRLHGAPSALPAFRAAPASAGFRARVAPVRSCRRALLWPRCAPSPLGWRRPRRRDPNGAGRAGAQGRGPGGLCPPSPPTGVSPSILPDSRGRGRWRAAGNRAKSEESTATGLRARAPPSLRIHTPHTHTSCTPFTHKQPCLLTNTLCHKFRPTVALSHILGYTGTTAPGAWVGCDHEGSSFAGCWGECIGSGQNKSFLPALLMCCPQLHVCCSLHNVCTW